MDQLTINDLPLLDKKIDDYITDYFISNNIDLSDYKTKVSLKHSTFNNLFRNIYKNILSNNSYIPFQHNSLIDYNNNDILLYFANKFIDICTEYNKSLGLLSFCYFIGVDYIRIQEWISAEGEKLNPGRAFILNKLREAHKAQHISLMNDSGLGLLAVANNDAETGLQWQEKVQTATQQTTVYLLPSERVDRLRIENKAGGPVDVNEV